MTLDELCYVCKVSPRVIDHWADLGAFGPRYREKRDRGWHRHVTRELAQRATIMGYLLGAGLDESAAATASAAHRVNARGSLEVAHGPVFVMINRDLIDLP